VNKKHCLDCNVELGLHNCYASHFKHSKYVCKKCQNKRDNLRPCRKAYLKEYTKKHYVENRETYRKKQKQWKLANPKIRREQRAKYRAKKLQRTPGWCDLDQIKQIYSDCPDNMAIDHIIPLQGEFVSGLHVPENLQYLDLSTNSTKGVFFDCFDYLEWVNNGGLENRFTTPYLTPYLRIKSA